MSLTLTNDAEPADPETTSLESSEPNSLPSAVEATRASRPRSPKAVGGWPLPWVTKVLWCRLLAHLPVVAALLADPETTSRESSDTQTPYRPPWVEPWLPARDRRKSRKWLAKYAKYDRNTPTTKLGAPSAARVVGPMSEPAVASRWWNTRWFRALALGLVVGGAVVLAIELHRRGHAQGDDFALYLRQAQSIFEGDIGAVVADNRFAVLNSDPQFSPIAYPWGWPLLLSPLVHAWGLDYDRLKLVEVALFAVWLVLMHGIVRRRIGRWMALAVVAVIGTAPQFLAHTDRLMSEFPYLATVGVVIWWYDRIRARSSLLTARVVDLVVLGVLVATAFNVRREGMALIVVVAAMQAVELVARVRHTRGNRVRQLGHEFLGTWRTIFVPLGTYGASVVLFQLLLPTALLPDNGNKPSYIDDRWADYPRILSQHVGLGTHPAVGAVILLIALAGVVVGVRKRTLLDLPLGLLALFSAMIIGTHFRTVDRYWLQVTPWVLYFAAVATSTAASWVFGQRRGIALLLGATPLLFLVAVHAVVLADDVSAARDFNDSGRTQVGPANPTIAPIYEVVLDHTPPDAVIAFFRARTMTLLTDRRSIQTSSLDKIRGRADYFAQRRDRTFWQPPLTEAQARELGFEEVWSDPLWILWRIPSQ
jgi:hypothetical protein